MLTTNDRTIKIKILGDAAGTPKIIEKEYRSMFAQIEKDARAASASFKQIFSSAGTVGGAKREITTGGGFDRNAQRAEADIRRYQLSQVRAERELTSQLEKEYEQRFRAKQAQLQRGLRETERILKEETAEQRRASQAASSSSPIRNTAIGSFVGNLGANAVSALSSELYSGGAALLQYSSKLEQARIGLTSLTGSAAAANAHIKDLQNFAKTTPFDLDGLVRASQLLQGVGIKTTQIIPILSDFGNALSAAGKGNEEIQRTILALSQIASKGKLAGQEINQLAENGIPAVSILAQALGKPKDEIIKLSEQGRISFDLLIAAMHKVVEENHIGDAMEKQSHTFNGATENIKDSLYQLADTAFKPLFDKASHIADTLAQEVSKQDADFNSVGKAIGAAISAGLGLVIAESTKGIKNELARELGKILNGDFSELSTPAGFGAAVGKDALKAGGKISVGERYDQLTAGVYGRKPQFQIDAARQAQIDVDAQTRRLIEVNQIKKKYGEGNFNDIADINRRNEFFNKFANANSKKPLVPDGGIIIKQDQKSIQYLDKLTSTIKTIAIETKKVPSLTDLLLPGKEKKGRGGKGGINPFDELEAIGTQLGFIATSKFRKGGPNGATDHAGKGAVDFGVNTNAGKTIDDYTRLAIAALERGKQVIDERVVGFFKGIKGGKNLHIGNSDNKSLFLPQSFYSVPVDYLKELDRKRKDRKGFDVNTSDITKTFNEKIDRENREVSDKLTKKERDDFIQRQIDVYKIVGVIPSGETLNSFREKARDEAQKAGKAQPTENDITQKFTDDARNRTGLVTTTPAKIQTEITTPADENEKFLANLKEQLGIRQDIEDLIFKTNNFEATVGLTTQAAIHKQAIDLRNAEIEYEVTHKQNADETFVQLRRQLSALGEINSLEREYAALQDEAFNAGNGELVSMRQRNRLQQEQNDLVRQAQDLKAEVDGGEQNQSLKIQIALYRDLIEIRGRDTEAITAQNKAQIELADAGTLHVEQLRANVLQHLAQQKTLTQTLSDSIIGIYDKIGAASDKFIDKKLKIGKIPIVGDLVKNFARQGLTNITRGLLDQFAPKKFQDAFGLNTPKPTGNPQVDAINTGNKTLIEIDKKLGNLTGIGGGLPSLGGGGTAQGGIQGLVTNFFRKLTGGGSASSHAANLNLGTLLGGSSGGGVFNFANPNGGAGATNQDVIAQLLGKASESGRAGLTTTTTNIGEILGGGSNLNGATGTLATLANGEKAFNVNGSSGGGIGLLQKLFGKVGKTPGISGGFAGLGIGSSFGGGSTSGRILGGVGGAIGGTLLAGLLTSGSVAGATTGGIFGASAGLFGLSGAATFGIGAAIAGGALLGSYLIGKNAQRRKDEKARTEYLHDAIGGLSQFDDLIRDVRGLRVQPDAAITQGTQIGATLRAQYLQNAQSIKDRKTRDIALRSVSELDYNIGVKMSQLRAAADFAGSAADRKNRIIPEFAGGNFFGRDDQLREQRQLIDGRRGLITGGRPGVDRHLGLFADGEMILNSRHQEEIKRGAGYDVFRHHTRIPNYAEGNFFAPQIVAPSSSQINQTSDTRPIYINITIEGDGISDARIKQVAIDGLDSKVAERAVTNLIKKVRGSGKL